MLETSHQSAQQDVAQLLRMFVFETEKTIGTCLTDYRESQLVYSDTFSL